MSVNPIADRYASAIFELAEEQHQLDEVGAELNAIAHNISEVPDLGKLLNHPLVTRADKAATLVAISAGATATTRNFLQLVVDKDRQNLLTAIAAAYTARLDARFKRVKATATTAVAISDESKAQLERQLSEYLAQDVTLETRCDPAILGGVVVRVGDRLIDGSVKGRLQELANSLN